MPEVGDVARRTRTVTSRDIELFTELTGDRNPLHYDEAAARAWFACALMRGYDEHAQRIEASGGYIMHGYRIAAGGGHDGI